MSTKSRAPKVRACAACLCACLMVGAGLDGWAIKAALAQRPARRPPTGAGEPLAGLTEQQLTDFEAGRELFAEVEGVADGLGPVFTERSCAACHSSPAIGGGSERFVTRIGTLVNGVFDPLVALGGPLIQDRAIPPGVGVNGPYSFRPEIVPRQATIRAQRRTTPLFGLGLVEAVPDQAFLALAQAQAQAAPAVAGIPHMVTTVSTGRPAVGRFGWKAQHALLLDFAGDAYVNEMGITTPLFPNENPPQGNVAALAANPLPNGVPNDGDNGDLEAFTTFMRFLAPPAPLETTAAQQPAAPPATPPQNAAPARAGQPASRPAPTGNRQPAAQAPANGRGGEQRPAPAQPPVGDATVGAGLFVSIGCAACHTPRLQTGDNPVAALHRQTFAPYADFLLHDMGTLGDGITQGQATGRLMRTAPLWGLRFQTRLLHDGRARNVTEAIRQHAGQGAASRDAFVNLSAAQQNHLLAFLNSL